MSTFGSLFAGIGGFDLGLERAGWGCRWQVEIDEKCQAVLERHWPDVERCDDVRECETLPEVDLICGGFPCQDLSVAGRRRGLAGERSGLWWEFHRILGALRPRWVVVENVPGLLSSHEGQDMGLLLGGLAELGYGWAYRVLDAQYFGVAQRRRRVFIVGHLGDGRRAAEVLFDAASLQRNPPARREAGARFAAPIASSPPGGSGYRNDADTAGRNLIAAQCHGSNVEPMGHLRKGDGGVTSGVPFVAQGITAHYGKGTDSDQTDTLVAFNCQQDPVSGEMARGLNGGADQAVALAFRTAQTVANGLGVSDKAHALDSAPEAVLASHPRRLTPRECERLQGFPDDWTAGLVDSPRYRMLGNAVAVPVAEWIGRQILALC